ncbi:MAG: hypothetical protein GF409_04065 [Candidatus Omnitrophica bacterium]|nr:hypothetical protein [Candidatus Omnitrophota bacterium]
MLKRTKFLKIVSILILLIFVHEQLGWTYDGTAVWTQLNEVPSRSGNKLTRQIKIPNDVGEVCQASTGQAGEVIINIQDAHASLSSQHSIVDILDTLVANYDVRFIALEGSQGYIDTTLLKTFPDEKIRKNTAEFLMREGRMSAGEFFDATRDRKDLVLYGVEDNALYRRNVEGFRKIMDERAHYARQVIALRDQLDELAKKIFSPELYLLARCSRLHRQGRLSFSDYWKEIKGLSGDEASVEGLVNVEKLLESIRTEENIDFAGANLQRRQLIDVLSGTMDQGDIEKLVLRSLLFKKNKISQSDFHGYLIDLAEAYGVDLSCYGDLARFTEYVRLYESIDIISLFREVSLFEERLRESLFRNGDERELARWIKLTRLTGDLYNVELSNDDYADIASRIGECDGISCARFIRRACTEYGVPVGPGYDAGNIFGGVEKALEFYRVAEERNSAILTNTIRSMRRENKQVAALITGGFHTGGLTRLMRENRLSYLVVTPKFEKGKERPYIAILTNKKKPYQRLLESGKYQLAISAYFQDMDEDKFVSAAVYALSNVVKEGGNWRYEADRWYRLYRDEHARLKEESQEKIKGSLAPEEFARILGVGEYEGQGQLRIENWQDTVMVARIKDDQSAYFRLDLGEGGVLESPRVLSPRQGRKILAALDRIKDSEGGRGLEERVGELEGQLQRITELVEGDLKSSRDEELISRLGTDRELLFAVVSRLDGPGEVTRDQVASKLKADSGFALPGGWDKNARLANAVEEFTLLVKDTRKDINRIKSDLSNNQKLVKSIAGIFLGNREDLTAGNVADFLQRDMKEPLYGRWDEVPSFRKAVQEFTEWVGKVTPQIMDQKRKSYHWDIADQGRFDNTMAVFSMLFRRIGISEGREEAPVISRIRGTPERPVKVLEVGSGKLLPVTGYFRGTLGSYMSRHGGSFKSTFTRAYEEGFPNLKAEAIDPRLEDRPEKGFHRGNALKMDMFKDEDFDDIFAFMVFNPECYYEYSSFNEEFWEENFPGELMTEEKYYGKIAAELLRILKPGGRLYMSTGTRHNDIFNRILLESGFRCEYLDNEVGYQVFAKPAGDPLSEEERRVLTKRSLSRVYQYLTHCISIIKAQLELVPEEGELSDSQIEALNKIGDTAENMLEELRGDDLYVPYVKAVKNLLSNDSPGSLYYILGCLQPFLTYSRVLPPKRNINKKYYQHMKKSLEEMVTIASRIDEAGIEDIRFFDSEKSGEEYVSLRDWQRRRPISSSEWLTYLFDTGREDLVDRIMRSTGSREVFEKYIPSVNVFMEMADSGRVAPGPGEEELFKDTRGFLLETDPSRLEELGGFASSKIASSFLEEEKRPFSSGGGGFPSILSILLAGGVWTLTQGVVSAAEPAAGRVTFSAAGALGVFLSTGTVVALLAFSAGAIVIALISSKVLKKYFSRTYLGRTRLRSFLIGAAAFMLFFFTFNMAESRGPKSLKDLLRTPVSNAKQIINSLRSEEPEKEVALGVRHSLSSIKGIPAETILTGTGTRMRLVPYSRVQDLISSPPEGYRIYGVFNTAPQRNGRHTTLVGSQGRVLRARNSISTRAGGAFYLKYPDGTARIVSNTDENYEKYIEGEDFEVAIQAGPLVKENGSIKDSLPTESTSRIYVGVDSLTNRTKFMHVGSGVTGYSDVEEVLEKHFKGFAEVMLFDCGQFDITEVSRDGVAGKELEGEEVYCLAVMGKDLPGRKPFAEPDWKKSPLYLAVLSGIAGIITPFLFSDGVTSSLMLILASVTGLYAASFGIWKHLLLGGVRRGSFRSAEYRSSSREVARQRVQILFAEISRSLTGGRVSRKSRDLVGGSIDFARGPAQVVLVDEDSSQEEKDILGTDHAAFDKQKNLLYITGNMARAPDWLLSVILAHETAHRFTRSECRANLFTLFNIPGAINTLKGIFFTPVDYRMASFAKDADIRQRNTRKARLAQLLAGRMKNEGYDISAEDISTLGRVFLARNAFSGDTAKLFAFLEKEGIELSRTGRLLSEYYNSYRDFYDAYRSASSGGRLDASLVDANRLLPIIRLVDTFEEDQDRIGSVITRLDMESFKHTFQLLEEVFEREGISDRRALSVLKTLMGERDKGLINMMAEARGTGALTVSDRVLMETSTPKERIYQFNNGLLKDTGEREYALMVFRMGLPERIKRRVKHYLEANGFDVASIESRKAGMDRVLSYWGEGGMLEEALSELAEDGVGIFRAKVALARGDGRDFENWFARVQSEHPELVSVKRLGFWLEVLRRGYETVIVRSSVPRERLSRKFAAPEEAVGMKFQDFFSEYVVGDENAFRAEPESLRGKFIEPALHPRGELRRIFKSAQKVLPLEQVGLANCIDCPTYKKLNDKRQIYLPAERGSSPGEIPAVVRRFKKSLAPVMPLDKYAILAAPWVEETFFFFAPMFLGGLLFGVASYWTIALVAAVRGVFFFLHERPRELMSMPQEEILKLFNPSYQELRKHVYADLKYVTALAGAFGIEEGSEEMYMLRVIALTHDLGGVLGVKRDEQIEKKLMLLALNKNVAYRNRDPLDVEAELVSKGAVLTDEEKAFISTMDHSNNSLRILDSCDIKVPPVVRKIISGHMESPTQKELAGWTEQERRLFACFAIADVFETGNNYYKQTGRDPEYWRSFESPDETMKFIREVKFRNRHLLVPYLEKAEEFISAGGFQEAIEFSRKPISEAEMSMEIIPRAPPPRRTVPLAVAVSGALFPGLPLVLPQLSLAPGLFIVGSTTLIIMLHAAANALALFSGKLPATIDTERFGRDKRHVILQTNGNVSDTGDALYNEVFSGAAQIIKEREFFTSEQLSILGGNVKFRLVEGTKYLIDAVDLTGKSDWVISVNRFIFDNYHSDKEACLTKLAYLLASQYDHILFTEFCRERNFEPGVGESAAINLLRDTARVNDNRDDAEKLARFLEMAKFPLRDGEASADETPSGELPYFADFEYEYGKLLSKIREGSFYGLDFVGDPEWLDLIINFFNSNLEYFHNKRLKSGSVQTYLAFFYKMEHLDKSEVLKHLRWYENYSDYGWLKAKLGDDFRTSTMIETEEERKVNIYYNLSNEEYRTSDLAKRLFPEEDPDFLKKTVEGLFPGIRFHVRDLEEVYVRFLGEGVKKDAFYCMLVTEEGPYEFVLLLRHKEVDDEGYEIIQPNLLEPGEMEQLKWANIQFPDRAPRIGSVITKPGTDTVIQMGVSYLGKDLGRIASSSNNKLTDEAKLHFLRSGIACYIKGAFRMGGFRVVDDPKPQNLSSLDMKVSIVDYGKRSRGDRIVFLTKLVKFLASDRGFWGIGGIGFEGETRYNTIFDAFLEAFESYRGPRNINREYRKALGIELLRTIYEDPYNLLTEKATGEPLPVKKALKEYLENVFKHYRPSYVLASDRLVEEFDWDHVARRCARIDAGEEVVHFASPSSGRNPYWYIARMAGVSEKAMAVEDLTAGEMEDMVDLIMLDYLTVPSNEYLVMLKKLSRRLRVEPVIPGTKEEYRAWLRTLKEQARALSEGRDIEQRTPQVDGRLDGDFLLSLCRPQVEAILEDLASLPEGYMPLLDNPHVAFRKEEVLLSVADRWVKESSGVEDAAMVELMEKAREKLIALGGSAEVGEKTPDDFGKSFYGRIEGLSPRIRAEVIVDEAARNGITRLTIQDKDTAEEAVSYARKKGYLIDLTYYRGIPAVGWKKAKKPSMRPETAPVRERKKGAGVPAMPAGDMPMEKSGFYRAWEEAVFTGHAPGRYFPTITKDPAEQLGSFREGAEFLYNYKKIIPGLNYIASMEPDEREMARRLSREIFTKLRIEKWPLKDTERLNSLRGMVRNLMTAVYNDSRTGEKMRRIMRGVTNMIGLLTLFREHALCIERLIRSGKVPGGVDSLRPYIPEKFLDVPGGVSEREYFDFMAGLVPYQRVFEKGIHAELSGTVLERVDRGTTSMKAYTSDQLHFVVKFPDPEQQRDVRKDIKSGLVMARMHLGGLAANTLPIRDISIRTSQGTEQLSEALIQTKVTPLGEAISQMDEAGDSQGVESLLAKWWNLQKQMWQRGVLDRRMDLLNGYGYDEVTGRVLLIGFHELSREVGDFWPEGLADNIIELNDKRNIEKLSETAPLVNAAESYASIGSEIKEGLRVVKNDQGEVYVSLWPSEEEMSSEELYIPLNDPFRIDDKEFGKIIGIIERLMQSGSFFEGELADEVISGMLAHIKAEVFGVFAEREQALPGEAISPAGPWGGQAPLEPSTLRSLKRMVLPGMGFWQYALGVAPWLEEVVFFAAPAVISHVFFGLDAVGAFLFVASSRAAFFMLHEGARPHAPPAEYFLPLAVSAAGAALSVLPGVVPELGSMPAVFIPVSTALLALLHLTANVVSFITGYKPASIDGGKEGPADPWQGLDRYARKVYTNIVQKSFLFKQAEEGELQAERYLNTYEEEDSEALRQALNELVDEHYLVRIEKEEDELYYGLGEKGRSMFMAATEDLLKAWIKGMKQNDLKWRRDHIRDISFGSMLRTAPAYKQPDPERMALFKKHYDKIFDVITELIKDEIRLFEQGEGNDSALGGPLSIITGLMQKCSALNERVLVENMVEHLMMLPYSPNEKVRAAFQQFYMKLLTVDPERARTFLFYLMTHYSEYGDAIKETDNPVFGIMEFLHEAGDENFYYFLRRITAYTFRDHSGQVNVGPNHPLRCRTRCGSYGPDLEGVIRDSIHNHLGVYVLGLLERYLEFCGTGDWRILADEEYQVDAFKNDEFPPQDAVFPMQTVELYKGPEADDTYALRRSEIVREIFRLLEGEFADELKVAGKTKWEKLRNMTDEQLQTLYDAVNEKLDTSLKVDYAGYSFSGYIYAYRELCKRYKRVASVEKLTDELVKLARNYRVSNRVITGNRWAKEDDPAYLAIKSDDPAEALSAILRAKRNIRNEVFSGELDYDRLEIMEQFQRDWGRDDTGNAYGGAWVKDDLVGLYMTDNMLTMIENLHIERASRQFMEINSRNIVSALEYLRVLAELSYTEGLVSRSFRDHVDTLLQRKGLDFSVARDIIHFMQQEFVEIKNYINQNSENYIHAMLDAEGIYGERRTKEFDRRLNELINYDKVYNSARGLIRKIGKYAEKRRGVFIEGEEEKPVEEEPLLIGGTVPGEALDKTVSSGRYALSSKGLELARTSSEGLPIPEGVIIPATASDEVTDELAVEGIRMLERHLNTLEGFENMKFGSSQDPLIVSVRSGAYVVMPGQMPTIANVGLSRDTIDGFTDQLVERGVDLRDARWTAWDCYSRFLQSYGVSVLGISEQHFISREEDLLSETGAADKKDLSLEKMKALAGRFEGVIIDVAGRDKLPLTAEEQFKYCVAAVKRSWAESDDYRDNIGLKGRWPGTAVLIQRMVFGNINRDSGVGVVNSRMVNVRKLGLEGDFLWFGQGDDIAQHRAEGLVQIQDIGEQTPWKKDLERYAEMIETSLGTMAEIEFTVELGKVYILQVRDAYIDVRAQDYLLMPSEGDLLARRGRVIPASGGAYRGKVYVLHGRKPDLEEIDRLYAESRAAGGDGVLIVADDLSPEQLGRLILRDDKGRLKIGGIITKRGGKLSHAGDIARAHRMAAVANVKDIRFQSPEIKRKGFFINDRRILEGEMLSISGTTGIIYQGLLPLSVGEFIDGGIQPTISYSYFVEHLKRRGQVLTVINQVLDAIQEKKDVNLLAYLRTLVDVHSEMLQKKAPYVFAVINGVLESGSIQIDQLRSKVKDALGQKGGETAAGAVTKQMERTITRALASKEFIDEFGISSEDISDIIFMGESAESLRGRMVVDLTLQVKGEGDRSDLIPLRVALYKVGYDLDPDLLATNETLATRLIDYLEEGIMTGKQEILYEAGIPPNTIREAYENAERDREKAVIALASRLAELDVAYDQMQRAVARIGTLNTAEMYRLHKAMDRSFTRSKMVFMVLPEKEDYEAIKIRSGKVYPTLNDVLMSKHFGGRRLTSEQLKGLKAQVARLLFRAYDSRLDVYDTLSSAFGLKKRHAHMMYSEMADEIAKIKPGDLTEEKRELLRGLFGIEDRSGIGEKLRYEYTRLGFMKRFPMTIRPQDLIVRPWKSDKMKVEVVSWGSFVRRADENEVLRYLHEQMKLPYQTIFRAMAGLYGHRKALDFIRLAYLREPAGTYLSKVLLTKISEITAVSSITVGIPKGTFNKLEARDIARLDKAAHIRIAVLESADREGMLDEVEQARRRNNSASSVLVDTDGKMTSGRTASVILSFAREVKNKIFLLGHPEVTDLTPENISKIDDLPRLLREIGSKYLDVLEPLELSSVSIYNMRVKNSYSSVNTRDRVKYSPRSLDEQKSSRLVHYADGQDILDGGRTIVPPGLEIARRRRRMNVTVDNDRLQDSFMIMAPESIRTLEEKNLFRDRIIEMWMLEGVISKQDVIILDRKEEGYSNSDLFERVRQVEPEADVSNVGIRVISGKLGYENRQLLQLDLAPEATNNFNQYEVFVNLLLTGEPGKLTGLAGVKALEGKLYIYLPEARPVDFEKELRVYYEKYRQVLIRA